MNEELSRELENIVEMFGDLFDELNKIFDVVSDFIKELSDKVKGYFNSPSKNDNSAPLSYVVPVSQIIKGYKSYVSQFNREKFIALVLSFHLKILPVNRLQRSGI